MALYVPPTEERDPKKQNQSLQLIGGVTQTNTDNIATNTADIATNTADIATNTADIATNTAAIAAIVVPSAATQAEQVTATSTTVMVTPGRQQYHPSAAKAWGHVVVSGTSISSSHLYGCTVSRTGVGAFTITFATAFTGARNYVVVGSGYNDPDNAFAPGAQSTGSVDVNVWRSGAAFDASFAFAIFGTQ